MSVNDRYQVHRFPATYGGEYRYGIIDHSFNPEKWVDDFHKGARKRPWRGTQEAAEHMCAELNKNKRKGDKDQSMSQTVRHIANARKRNVAVPKVAFKKCACGAMYKGEKHCDA